MSSYLLRRLGLTLAQLLVVSTLLFFFIHLLPGDPAGVILGSSDLHQPSREQLDAVRRQLGLERSILVQYVGYLGGLMRGDLGTSFLTGRPVALDLGLRFGRTAQLVIPSIILSSLIGIVLGVLAARSRGRWQDAALTTAGIVGHSLPVFVTGNLMVLLFAIYLGWLPSSGFTEFTGDARAAIAYMIMPVTALAIGRAAATMRMTRTTVVEQLTLDYVRTARSKGLAERVVLYRHVVRNALIPVIAVVGLQMGLMFSGAIVVEAIFNWPGMGSLLLKSIGGRDYPVIQGAILLTSTIFVLVNLCTDLVYAYLNPQIRYR